MPITQEITDILSQLGLPAGAIALAVGLVRGAAALEKDASEAALKYVSSLLVGGDLSNLGKLAATLIPRVFDRIFGSRPLSYKFILRSFVATTFFWLVLIEVKHPNWGDVVDNAKYYLVYLPMWYIIDWISLTKAKLLMNIITIPKYALLSITVFVVMDVGISYILASIGYFTLILVQFHPFPTPIVFDWFITGAPIFNYLFGVGGHNISIWDVLAPSTLLTSIWTVLVMISSVLAMLLIPIDYLRRFTAFWFRNVEQRPLTALAKVTGTLIIIGTVVTRAIR